MLASNATTPATRQTTAVHRCFATRFALLGSFHSLGSICSTQRTLSRRMSGTTQCSMHKLLSSRHFAEVVDGNIE